VPSGHTAEALPAYGSTAYARGHITRAASGPRLRRVPGLRSRYDGSVRRRPCARRTSAFPRPLPGPSPRSAPPLREDRAHRRRRIQTLGFAQFRARRWLRVSRLTRTARGGLCLRKRAVLHPRARALLPATCEPLVAADHHCHLHARAPASGAMRSGRKRQRPKLAGRSGRGRPDGGTAVPVLVTHANLASAGPDRPATGDEA
jgi:hypothetical protein